MSYILDALRKADQERSIGDVPDLDTPHWSRRRGGHIRYWVWGGIGLLIVNGALLAFLFNRDDSADAGPRYPATSRSQTQNKSPAPPIQSFNTGPLRSHSAGKPVPLKPLARPERKVITKPRQPVPAGG